MINQGTLRDYFKGKQDPSSSHTKRLEECYLSHCSLLPEFKGSCLHEAKAPPIFL